jgi:hypothetical protein
MQKVYLLQLMPVCVGNNASCLFVLLINYKWSIMYIAKSGLACCLYCTKSGWRCIGRLPPALAENLHNPSANGKQGPIPEEICQTPLTNKKQGNLD